ncbi:hypothetical protein [Streptomyces sp. NRRL F-2890]|uniref:hypothetical protein n=1 Tax=Streptomyces sp. NRRL F-2890 TaxID=1463845 RepID=UPI00131A5D63|nr:hypothetical protein [Streptomyces sp. NRRL F-2890]
MSKILDTRRIEIPRGIHGRSARKTAILAAAVGCGVLAISSCSGESQKPDASGVSAGEVCAGIFSTDAATGLESISGTDVFGELPEVPADEFSASIERLRSGGEAEERLCSIYAPPDDDLPSVTISFRWALPNFSGDGDGYATGMVASILPNAAIVAFQCEGEDYPPDKVMLGSLHVRSGSEEPHGQMAMINAASRAVAEGLGCLDESGLVEGVPQPVGD